MRCIYKEVLEKVLLIARLVHVFETLDVNHVYGCNYTKLQQIMRRFRLDEFNLMPMNSDDDRLQLDYPRFIHGTSIMV
jgi:hypothetical protein